MRRIVRLKLSTDADAYLASLGARVDGAPVRERPKVARRLWKQARKTAAFKEVRRKLRRMATGLRRCMYCEDSRGVDIDHFWPLAAYPERAFRWQNHLFACAYCNNKKSGLFPLHPLMGSHLLVKPTKDDPRDHLVYLPSSGRFDCRDGSLKGEPTIKVFGLNSRRELPQGRQDAFKALQRLIMGYASYRRRGFIDDAGEVAKEVLRRPFSALFSYFLDIAASPRAADTIRPECLAALDDCPEIKTWR